MNKLDVIKFNQGNVYTGISKKGYGKTYFAKKDFKAHEALVSGYGKIIDHQTAHISVQIGKKKHYLPTKWTGRYWNHSCNPNAYVKTRSDGFPNWIASRNIKKGEELSYPYWTTEYEWAKHTDEYDMTCKCGEKMCYGKIFSFSQLPNHQKSKLVKKGLHSKYLRHINKK